MIFNFNPKLFLTEFSITGLSKQQRKKRTKKEQRKQVSSQTATSDGNQSGSETNENATDELTYIDTLPEHLKLVEVTSNIWGTKFKIHGLAKAMIPANLGMVTYKTSLLHLQPRQMTLVITELRDDFPILPDPSFNPNIFSEDEDEFNVKSVRNKPPKSRDPVPHCSNSGHPPIAPMTPRPKNRYASPHHSAPRSSLSYASNSHLNSSNSSASTSSSSSANLPSSSKTTAKSPPRSLGPLLAKQESYDDDLFETPVLPSKNLLNYSNIISSYSHGRSLASTSNNQSRVAISPLYCEQSLPTLQSPKNAVAPSDVAFERPHAGQTTLMNYSSNNSDYLNNLTHVKNALSHEHARQNSHVNPVPINLNVNVEKLSNDGKSLQLLFSKKKSIEYIDDEPTPSTSTQPDATGGLNRTQTVISFSTVLPDVMTRSCSVGYLDNVEMVPGDVTLSQLRNEAQKRLVLVDRKIQSNRKNNRKICGSHQYRAGVQNDDRYKSFKKSISLDSYDIFQNIPNLSKDLNNLFNQMPKLTESSENNTEDTENSSTELAISAAKKPKKTPRERICSLFSPRGTPVLGRKFNNSSPTPSLKNLKNDASTNEVVQPIDIKKKSLLSKWRKQHNSSYDQTESQGESSKNSRERRRNKNLEIITSFTDSPLFSRKYRSSKNEILSNTGTRSQMQSEQNTPILNRRNGARSDIEVTQLDSKASVSLHTQAS